MTQGTYTAQTKKQAMQKYIAMKVVNYSQLSRLTSVPVEQLHEWSAEDNWVSLRRKREEQTQVKLRKLVGGDVQSMAIDTLVVARKTLEVLAKQAKEEDRTSVTELQRAAKDAWTSAREAADYLGMKK